MKSFRLIFQIALVCLLLAGTVPAQPQGGFDWCGILEDFEGCVAFYAVWPGPMGPVVLDNYGTFGLGDQVRVVGVYDENQFAICGGFEDIPVIIVSSIELCAVEWCGDLFAYNGCLLFNNRQGDIYGLSDYGAFVSGDIVRVSGNYVPGQQLVCDDGARFAVIDVASMEPCSLESCCRGLVDGDLNGDGTTDLSDLICFTTYVFIWPDPVCCMEEANVNGDPAGATDLTDLIYLVNYLFLGGPAPVGGPCVGP
ncbi:hypothetical protein KQH82_07405 [bacterium]|nr:hypothetical protein [bacterium]